MWGVGVCVGGGRHRETTRERDIERGIEREKEREKETETERAGPAHVNPSANKRV